MLRAVDREVQLSFNECRQSHTSTTLPADCSRLDPRASHRRLPAALQDREGLPYGQVRSVCAACLPPPARVDRGPSVHRVRSDGHGALDRNDHRLVHQEVRHHHPTPPHHLGAPRHPDPARQRGHHDGRSRVSAGRSRLCPTVGSDAARQGPGSAPARRTSHVAQRLHPYRPSKVPARSTQRRLPNL